MNLPLKSLFFLLLFIGSYVPLFADGSKDLYPAEVGGNRAFMVSVPVQGHPLANQGIHYVYAKAGETIAVASSAQGIEHGQIWLISPNGIKYDTFGLGSIGNIPSRQAELEGPDKGYTPYKQVVESGEEGIWRVEFVPPTVQDAGPPPIRADANWTQAANRLIAAWDISVRNTADTEWISGRVFTHVLNLYLASHTLNDENGAYYGENYVLTKDGYIYKVNGNGSHGISFYFFVNSTGMLNGQGQPSYKSLNTYPKGSYHSPNTPDSEDGVHVTHKMFYTMPDTDMPTASRGALPGGETWLYNETQIAEISHVSLRQIEGDDIYVNYKGAFIDFETNFLQNARYEIVIETKVDGGVPPMRRTIIHNGTYGLNSAYWDGLDNNGVFMPEGKHPITISVALLEGEIHFPYFDMEINPNGIAIDRINPDGSYNGPATVYWDDRDIYSHGPEEEKSEPLYFLGGDIGSDQNRHSWGSYRQNDKWFTDQYTVDRSPQIPIDMRNANYGAYSFGNEKAMDTWSYGISPQKTKDEEITVRVTDLEIVSLTSPQRIIEPGELLTYHVVARNNGPSDAIGASFEFRLPDGFVIEKFVMESGCDLAAEHQPHTTQGNTALSTLDLPNGCTITYRIEARTIDVIPDATYGYLNAFAGIVRPIGYTDPDATSKDPTKLVPGTAEEECRQGCNNIKRHGEVFLLEYEHERGHLALVKTVEQVDPILPGFFQVGDVVRYTFAVTNVGPHNGVHVENISIQDPMLSATPIVPGSTLLNLGQSTLAYRDYTITQADMDRKYVENTATVFGKNPRGFDVKDISGTSVDNDNPTRVTLDVKPLFQLKKTVINQGTGENEQFTVGDKIVYRLELKHEGDIGIESIFIEYPDGYRETVNLAENVFFNQTIVIHKDYYITAEDIKQGQVSVTAIAHGVDAKYGNILTDVSGNSFEDDLPTITTLAKPPQAIPDSFEIYQGHSGIFEVLINDRPGSSRLDGTSIEITSMPSLGTAEVIGDQIHYAPVDNYASGSDSFTYRVKDHSRLYSEEMRVDVLIKKTIPVAADDFFRVGYNFLGKLRPLSNDYVDFSELVPSSIDITTYPMYGEVFHEGEGILRYKPHKNFSGYDKIMYRVKDKNGNWSDPATIDIEVVAFIIPNVITPNGDNTNESLEIIGSYKFDYIELEVIDRFGRRVYYSSDYKNDWNVDNTLPEGTYFITFKGVRANGKPIIRKGSLLITRQRYMGY